MSTFEKDSWMMILMLMVSLAFGLGVGVPIGEWSEQKRIVIDQEHLIYDSVLYKQVVPDE